MIETGSQALTAYQEEKLAVFRLANQKVAKGQIVFVGDSIIEFFPLKKFLGRDLPLVNRGIAGTDSFWVLEHLKEQVLALEPEQVILQIGTNDIGQGYEIDAITKRVSEIIARIKEESYFTKITLLSVLPVNELGIYRETVKIRTNRLIQILNDELSVLPGVDFLPLYDDFLDESNQLSRELTVDGLHLNQIGYQVFTDSIRPYLL